jgi:hypothetical protein
MDDWFNLKHLVETSVKLNTANSVSSDTFYSVELNECCKLLMCRGQDRGFNLSRTLRFFFLACHIILRIAQSRDSTFQPFPHIMLDQITEKVQRKPTPLISELRPANYTRPDPPLRETGDVPESPNIGLQARVRQ